MVRAGVDSDAVVAAAMELADERGPANVTLTAIADKLGVKPPSLYAHVDGLDDVMRRVGAAALEELASDLGHAVEGRAGVDALRALAGAYRDFARRHPGAYELTQRARWLAADDEAQARGDDVVRVAMAVIRDYNLEGDDAIHATRLIRICLHGYIELELAGGFAMTQSTDETFERLVALLDYALRCGVEPDRLG
jgi:AcrR family transcriptional regulator